MRVLVTGAFGNIGSHTVDALLAEGHSVRALRFERRRSDRALLLRWGGRVEVLDGDLRVPATLTPLVRDVEVAVHLAFVIPPALFDDVEAARAVNVDGTRNLVAALVAGAPRARLLFASSLDVYGHTAHLPPPRTVRDPVAATDAYTAHKIECEELVRRSGLPWTILRFADVPPLELRKPVPIMFDVPLEQRIETIHPRDAGLATVRAISHEASWSRVWLIGGGPTCQVRYGEYLARFFAAMELGPPLPAEAFTTSPYCTDWLDTVESQRELRYQRASFDDIVRDVAALLSWRRPFARLLRSLVRRQMLRLSPYYRLPPGSSRERRARE